MNDMDQIKHDINNNIIKLRGMFEILVDSESGFDPKDVVLDAKNVLEELNAILNDLSI